MLLAREKKIVTLLMEHEDKLTTTQIHYISYRDIN